MELHNLPARQQCELLRGEHVRARLAILEQARLKEACDEIEHRHVEGIGEKLTSIGPELAARLRVKYGASCLHDPDFMRALLRDNAFLRIKNNGAGKLTLRVDGRRAEAGEVRREK